MQKLIKWKPFSYGNIVIKVRRGNTSVMPRTWQFLQFPFTSFPGFIFYSPTAYFQYRKYNATLKIKPNRTTSLLQPTSGLAIAIVFNSKFFNRSLEVPTWSAPCRVFFTSFRVSAVESTEAESHRILYSRLKNKKSYLKDSGRAMYFQKAFVKQKQTS